MANKEITVAAQYEVQAELVPQIEAVLQPVGGRFINNLKDITDSEVLAQVEVIYGNDVTSERLQQLPNLKWIHCSAAGVNRLIAVPEIRNGPTLLTNSSGVITKPVADQVMMFMLAFARQLPRQMQAQKQHEWSIRQVWDSMDELDGQTLGLVGYGHIAAAIAQWAKAFGMRVIATRNRPEQPATDLDQVFATEQLPELLAQADFVVVTAPLTTQTTGMLGAAQFDQMKPTAYLINIARGQLVKEAELIEALQTGKLAGAGLDVFEKEPLPSDSALWDMPNVIITPHSAGAYKKLDLRSVEFFCRQLQHYIKGESLENLIGKERGY